MTELGVALLGFIFFTVIMFSDDSAWKNEDGTDMLSLLFGIIFMCGVTFVVVK